MCLFFPYSFCSPHWFYKGTSMGMELLKVMRSTLQGVNFWAMLF